MSGMAILLTQHELLVETPYKQVKERNVGMPHAQKDLLNKV